MNDLRDCIKQYLIYCQQQKRLDKKTLKAYRIDLHQFSEKDPCLAVIEITSMMLEQYIAKLHALYKPKTVKRKIASLKALFHYLEYREFIEHNPFNKMLIHFREPVILPKTIPLHTVEMLLSTIYKQQEIAQTSCRKKNAIKDAAIVEMLFATGMRISELCSLKVQDVNLYDGTILIYGKGGKERCIQIGNESVMHILIEYNESFGANRRPCDSFFVNQWGKAISDQSVRRMINRYVDMASIDQHITPHMFRHTFATSLLEADVDIRYIQEMLGHSSINVTEIYTHVTVSKQRSILATKHPRNGFHL